MGNTEVTVALQSSLSLSSISQGRSPPGFHSFSRSLWSTCWVQTLCKVLEMERGQQRGRQLAYLRHVLVVPLTGVDDELDLG